MAESATHRLLIGGEMMLYGAVGASWWEDSFSAADVVAALAVHGNSDITVRLNSGGGSAFDGAAIHSLLRSHASKGAKVKIVVDGIAASAASLIAMAGDQIEMRLGAMMMIHDASGVTIGTSKDHEQSAGALDKISEQYAAVYASRSGKTREETRELMLAETWFGAEDAVAAGFADAVLNDAAEPAAYFDYRAYARAPADLVEARHRDSPTADRIMRAEAYIEMRADPAAPAATQEEPVMAEQTNEPAGNPATEKTAPVKEWATAFYASAEKSGLALVEINSIVAASADLTSAQASLINAMASAKPAPQIAPRADVTSDVADRFAKGAEKALLGKVGLDGGERNEFTSMSLAELARASLEAAGVRASFNGRLDMVRRAMMAAPGHHSTSDFPNLLGNVARKALLKGYDEQPETFEAWTASGTLPDFKTSTRIDIGLFPALAKVEEGAEYTYATAGDRGVTLSLAKYGRMFAITWEAIINDDLGVLSRIPRSMGRAARRTIGNLAYAVLTGNPNMSDGVALFHASHSNLATGGGSALSETSLQTARLAMRKQADPGGAATALNITPKYLIVPAALESTARELMTSVSKLGQSNPAIKNPVAGMAEIIVEPRLDAASTTAWYLAGDPNVYDTVEVSYLDGYRQPEMFEEQGFEVDGVRHKVRQVAGVNPLDWRALYKGVGA